MRRAAAGLKKLAELYLIIVGGGYALAFFVGMKTNGLGDEYFRDNTVALVMALSSLVAGIAIYRVQLWGLVLAIIMAILTLTITLPMLGTFVWAILPQTRSKFSKREIGAA